jgi:hypothetical protein
MQDAHRLNVYLRERTRLTPRQRRRAQQKRNLVEKRARRK